MGCSITTQLHRQPEPEPDQSQPQRLCSSELYPYNRFPVAAAINPFRPRKDLTTMGHTILARLMLRRWQQLQLRLQLLLPCQPRRLLRAKSEARNLNRRRLRWLSLLLRYTSKRWWVFCCRSLELFFESSSLNTARLSTRNARDHFPARNLVVV